MLYWNIWYIPLIKFIQNYIQDSGSIFSISSSLVKMLWEHLRILFESLRQSPVFLRTFSDRSVFVGNFREMFTNVRVAFGQFLDKVRKPSESGRKSWKNRQRWIMRGAFTYGISPLMYNFIQVMYLTRSLRSLVRYSVEHSKKYSLFTLAYALSSL